MTRRVKIPKGCLGVFPGLTPASSEPQGLRPWGHDEPVEPSAAEETAEEDMTRSAADASSWRCCSNPVASSDRCEGCGSAYCDNCGECPRCGE